MLFRSERGFEQNGLQDLIERLDNKSFNIKHVEFTDEDIVRSEVVKEVLKIYNS